MPFGDLARIRTNIGAMNAANALNNVNRDLGIHQLRLATGKRLNSVGEGPAEYSIAKELEGTAARWNRALKNVQDTSNLFSTAETGAVAIKDTLVQMSSLCEQAASDLLSADDRANVLLELKGLAREIDQTVEQTQYRGLHLLKGSYSANRSVWVGPTSDAGTSKLSFTVHGLASGLTFKQLTGVASITSMTVSTITAASSLLASLITAVAKVDKSAVNIIGTYEERLTIKEARIAEHETDVWATYSRIMNADEAEEQLAITKFTILQQAAVAGLAQANTAPSFVLGLLGQ
jgi:flagellin